MSASDSSQPAAAAPPPDVKVDLRDPLVAAVYAWLWPGAGHIYQRRYGKAALYMVCILGTYLFGLGMGQGHVVYASFKFEQDAFRWHYFLQLGVGLPAAPALVQYVRAANHRGPLFVDWMAPPGVIESEKRDRLAVWHEQSHRYFELGTLYTVVAGLLNILAIYDAYAGPVISHPDDDKKRKPPGDPDGGAKPNGDPPNSLRGQPVSEAAK